MNFELLNQIHQIHQDLAVGKEVELLRLTEKRRVKLDLLKDIHELYYNGYLHLPKYCHVFGYKDHCDISRFFKKNKLNTLNTKQSYELYGDIIKQKRSETCLDRFGVGCNLVSTETQEKIKSTNLKRYGFENPFQSPEIKERIKQTNLKKFGVDYPFQSGEIQEKIKSTNLKRYGFENPSQSPEIRDKRKQTNLKRYGFENPSQSPEIRDKRKQTNLRRFGSASLLGSPEIREKIMLTWREKLGYNNPLLSPEIQEKIRQTNLERYGVENPSQSPEIQEKIKATRKSNDSRYAKLEELVESELGKAHEYIRQNYVRCYHSTILRRYGLYRENLSTIEIAIRDILEKHKIEYQFRHRPKFMDRKELDFFIPIQGASNNPDTGKPEMAIEVNGLYWHSYPKKDKYYHQDKHLRCRSEGIQLLSFTEDQILEKSEIIESMILHKLGKTPYRLYAKNCTIRELSTQQAKDFLEKNHLHGFSNASVYLGLEYKGKLVHVMSFGNNRFKRSNHPELIRSASLRFHSVAGGFQRLLKYYKRSRGVNLVESYVDFNISNGQSYELASKDLGDLGVGPVRETVRETVRDNLTEPDLWFVYRGKRYRRQMFMKHNLHKIFKDFPKRSEDGYDDITVREFLEKRGVLEYYGAGNLRYLI